jgi:hypothetical protein
MKQTVHRTFTILLTIGLAALCLLQATAGYAATKPKPKPKQPAGGANQVQGLNGKLGQMLFTGYWRFEAIAAHTDLTSYTLKVPSAEQSYGGFRDVATFDSDTHTFTPKAGWTITAVDCLVKNGQPSVQTLNLVAASDTAVADDQGQSYPPFGYDMVTDGPAAMRPMLQGSSAKMTVLFAVPVGTKLKDMIFTLMTQGNGATKKDVRISLAK